MVELTAKSAAELREGLADVDISVAPRGEGRTSEQCERWSICRFLAAMAESGWFHYPIKLGKRERPDYLLAEEARLTGIEITEAVPTDWARADVRRSELGEQLLLMQRFHPGEAPRSRQEIERIARGESRGEGWVGDSPEREWAAAMLYAFQRKVEISAKPGFELFGRNWVLVYDNWPLPGVEDAKAAGYLMQKLEGARLSPFDHFFVETEKEIWHFGASEYGSHSIPDLWHDG